VEGVVGVVGAERRLMVEGEQLMVDSASHADHQHVLRYFRSNLMTCSDYHTLCDTIRL